MRVTARSSQLPIRPELLGHSRGRSHPQANTSFGAGMPYRVEIACHAAHDTKITDSAESGATALLPASIRFR